MILNLAVKKTLWIVIPVVIILGIAGGTYWMVVRHQQQTIPPSVQAKYDEIVPIYSQSLGAFLSYCRSKGENIYVVTGSGGYVNQAFYYDQGGSLIGESYTSDIANDPQTKQPPRNLSKYHCKILQKNT